MFDMEFLVSNESTVRLSIFFGVLVAMALLEALLPKKKRSMPRLQRWVTNLSLVVIDSVVLRLVTPVLAIGVASWALTNNIGLLNWLRLPVVAEFLVAFLLLDMLIYIQHVISHKLPVLWRFHKVHHTDRDIDVTTGVRFHPIEIILSMLYKLACVALIGPSVVVVIVFEIALNASAMFNHSNLSLTKPFDRFLRIFVVTPDFHRVHHSVIHSETDSNYGFFLSVWDRLFSTYIDQPQETHQGMVIGLNEHQTEQPSKLLWSLAVPFKKTEATQRDS